jgi:hypothetical protein
MCRLEEKGESEEQGKSEAREEEKCWEDLSPCHASVIAWMLDVVFL